MFKTCHKGPGHMEIKHFHQECVCVCGFNAHQPMDKEQGKKSDEKYSKKCLFGEWASECKYNIFLKILMKILFMFVFFVKIYAIKMLEI